MYQHFLALTAAAPGALALIEGDNGNIVARASLLRRSDELATELARAGMRSGDLLAVQLPNSVDFVATFLAALKLRLVFAPIDRDAPGTEVAKILSHFSIKGFVYRADRSSRISAISTRAVQQPPRLPAAACVMKLTSGSTGLPKAIVCSAANLIADSTNICSTMQIAPGDLNLGAIPFSHSYGFANLVLPLVLQGTAIVVTNDYMPLSTLALCNRYGCTVVPLIPMVFDLLSAQPKEDGEFDSVRTFISAGAPLTATASRRFRERFGVDIQTFYGCSEVGGSRTTGRARRSSGERSARLSTTSGSTSTRRLSGSASAATRSGSGISPTPRITTRSTASSEPTTWSSSRRRGRSS